MRIARRRLVSILVLAAALGMPAASRGLTCAWTGAASTNWADPANWSNCGGGIPGGGDTANITNVANQPTVSTATSVGGLSLGTGTTLTVASGGGNLTLDGPTTGAGNILVDGTLTWISGAMGGTGVTTVQPGGVLLLFNGASKVLSRNLGVMPAAVTTTTGGNSSLIVTDGVVFANSGLFHIQNGSSITGAGRFENLPNGIFRTSDNSGLVNITVANWVSTGLVEVLSGTLSFAAGVFVHGGTYLFDANRLSFPTGTHTVIGTLDGGTLEMNGPVDFMPEATLTSTVENAEIRGVATFNTGESLVFTSLLLDGGTLTGSDNVSAFLLPWPAGTITGSGILTIAPGGLLDMFGTGTRMLDRDAINGGSAVLGGLAGNLAIPSDRTFTNLATGEFVIANDSIVTGEAVFTNQGIFRRVTSTGPAVADFDFHNEGTVVLETGTTIFHHYHQSAGATLLVGGDLNVVHEVLDLRGGVLAGIDTIFARVNASGGALVSPGSSPGELTITGGYQQSEPAAYQVELAGTGAGQFDKLTTSGPAVLGGALNVSLSFAPSPSASFPVLTYTSRVGEFSLLNLPPPPAGLSWLARYGATEFTLRLQNMLPTDPIRVDTHPASGGGSNLNNVFEPGERVSVEPTWINPTAGPIGAMGTASSFTGPPGAVYTLEDPAADYGSIPGNGGTANCFDATANCLTVTVDDPLNRPAVHWDATLDETLTNGDVSTWTLHIGRSFDDVLVLDPYYRFVETLFHNGVTGGCGPTSFCPGVPVTRAEMAVFLLTARFGVSYIPPQATGTVFTDVPVDGFAAAHIEELAARQITSGCDVTLYCPNSSVTREQMAVFLLRTLEGPTYVPPDCVTPTFTDVPCSSGFAKWVNEIALRGITSGCGPNIYCPTSPVLRAQMAVFLTVTFTLGLNGA